MTGIDLNKPILFKHSSLRFFNKNEHHVNRFSNDDVLILVYEGILRFSENGVEQEIGPGEYYIQRADTYQRGDVASSSPKYLFVHFRGEWRDDEGVLPIRGTFSYDLLKPLIEELDAVSHGDHTYTEKLMKFSELLMRLYQKKTVSGAAGRIADYLSCEYLTVSSLDDLCRKFNFSKNHIINIFKKEYGVTPFDYINRLKIARAKYLLEVTSYTLERIAYESGFNDYSHFYRMFQRECGISPTQWRSRIKLQPSQG